MTSVCGTVKCSQAIPPAPVNFRATLYEHAHQLQYHLFLIARIWNIGCCHGTAQRPDLKKTIPRDSIRICASSEKKSNRRALSPVASTVKCRASRCAESPGELRIGVQRAAHEIDLSQLGR